MTQEYARVSVEMPENKDKKSLRKAERGNTMRSKMRIRFIF